MTSTNSISSWGRSTGLGGLLTHGDLHPWLRTILHLDLATSIDFARRAKRVYAVMAGQRRTTRSTRSAANHEAQTRTPRDIYSEMLVDAGVGSAEPERPLKRRRARRAGDGDGEVSAQGAPAVEAKAPVTEAQAEEDDEEEGVEFEDVEIPKPTIQTTYMGSEDEDSEDDDEGIMFEDVDFNIPAPDEKTSGQSEDKPMELNLTAQKAAMAPAKRGKPKKKPLTREEKARRLEIHKSHLLCMLYHCAMRNKWCNDEKVQKSLKKLLSQRMLNYLNPSRKLTQFGRTEALKKGLEEVGQMFRLKYRVTERGLRRALWAEDVEHLNKVRNHQRH